MSVKFKLSDLHIRKQNGTFSDLTALKGDRGLTAVQVSGTQPTDPDIDVWFKDQQSAPVMVYTTDEVYKKQEVDTMRGQMESNLAYINTGSTADKTYYKGDYLVYNGQLYVVTDTTISGGVTLNPGQGGNISAISVLDEIKLTSGTWTPVFPRCNIATLDSAIWYKSGNKITAKAGVIMGAQISPGALYLDQYSLPFHSSIISPNNAVNGIYSIYKHVDSGMDRNGGGVVVTTKSNNNPWFRASYNDSLYVNDVNGCEITFTLEYLIK